MLFSLQLLELVHVFVYIGSFLVCIHRFVSRTTRLDVPGWLFEGWHDNYEIDCEGTTSARGLIYIYVYVMKNISVPTHSPVKAHYTIDHALFALWYNAIIILAYTV